MGFEQEFSSSWGEELKIIGEENLTIKANNLFPNTNRLKDISIPSNFQRTVPISDVTVYVDPLDATREFTLGNTFCVVTLIGTFNEFFFLLRSCY
jgi:3'-phosphoadenosine 5'-phosphosulfate (PAPS) 3'-phosphatase